MQLKRITLASFKAALTLAALGAGHGHLTSNTDRVVTGVDSARSAEKMDRHAQMYGVGPGGMLAQRLANGWGHGSQTRYPRPGWSVRQGQRMARKRRNVIRNRRNH